MEIPMEDQQLEELEVSANKPVVKDFKRTTPPRPMGSRVPSVQELAPLQLEELEHFQQPELRESSMPLTTIKNESEV
jgi:hypothetical protein